MEQIPFRDTNKLGAPTLINLWDEQRSVHNTAPIARNAVSLPILAMLLWADRVRSLTVCLKRTFFHITASSFHETRPECFGSKKKIGDVGEA